MTHKGEVSWRGIMKKKRWHGEGLRRKRDFFKA
jgi:hypothetical protein